MKKFAVLAAVLFLAGFILLPATGNGKYNVSKPLVADGGPMPPPFPPNPPSLSLIHSDLLIADGGPMPPPFPPNPPSLIHSDLLVADGGPMPPPFPPNPPSLSFNIASV